MWRLNSEELAVSDENVKSLTVLHTAVAHDKDINSVCVSPNDKLIATGSQDKSAKVEFLAVFFYSLLIDSNEECS